MVITFKKQKWWIYYIMVGLMLLLNPGGVRIGTGEIYNSLQKFNWITDCLATGYLTDNDEKIILFLKSFKNYQII
jgi:acetoacetyl-CoA synthetase